MYTICCLTLQSACSLLQPTTSFTLQCSSDTHPDLARRKKLSHFVCLLPITYTYTHIHLNVNVFRLGLYLLNQQGQGYVTCPMSHTYTPQITTPSILRVITGRTVTQQQSTVVSHQRPQQGHVTSV